MLDTENLNIARMLRDISSDVCDHYCKWPDSYDVSSMGEDDASALLYDEHCNSCPLMQFFN